MSLTLTTDTLEAPVTIANRFVSARREARALSDFPGQIPSTMTFAYDVQESALEQWPAKPAGWKVGRIADDIASALGDNRLSGPIFESMITSAGATPITVPVIVGGFAAVEAEFVFRIGHDADPHKTAYDADSALALAEGLYFGLELAGSPLSTINDLGPTVVASDFGNNFGLIIGGPVEGWKDRHDASLACETFVDGQSVGRGDASGVLGGPVGALAWLAGHLARRGRPLLKGQWVTTGAVTGIHRIGPGQTAEVVFEGLGRLHLNTIAAQAAA